MEKAEFAPLVSSVSPAVLGMTFPAYRHLLSLEPASRHREQQGEDVVQPFGAVAWREGTPVGLALAEMPRDGDRSPEILSVFVNRTHRNRGIGTTLVRGIEERLLDEDRNLVEAVYMTGTLSAAAVERMLQKRQWSTPVARTLTLRFTLDEASSTPWFGRVRLSSPSFEIFPWRDLLPSERAELIRSQEEEPWIAPKLEPWQHDRFGFHEPSSLGLRYHGRVVGWVINHAASSDSVRFTCSFMREDLARRGRILALYTESLRRLRNTGCRMCSFVTPTCYGPMVDFFKRRCMPWASFAGETRGSVKVLRPTP
jgi:GNAT superfamily N-acetyltransferase